MWWAVLAGAVLSICVQQLMRRRGVEKEWDGPALEITVRYRKSRMAYHRDGVELTESINLTADDDPLEAMREARERIRDLRAATSRPEGA